MAAKALPGGVGKGQPSSCLGVLFDHDSKLGYQKSQKGPHNSSNFIIVTVLLIAGRSMFLVT